MVRTSLLAAACLLVSGTLPDRISAQVPEFNVVRGGYLESVAGLQSFDCQFRIERTFSEPESRNNDGVFAAMDVRLLQQGEQQARQIDYYNNRGELLTRAWTGFDGRRFASWEDAAGSLEDKRHLPFGYVKQQPINSLWTLESIDCLLGMNLSTGKLSLKQLFEQPEGRVVGWRNIAGQRCVEVAFPELPIFPDRPQVHRMQVTAWHDPAMGYLPRQIVVRSGDKADKGTFPVWTYRTEDFREVADDAGTMHRFPSRGVLESDLGVARITVTTVRINERLPTESFAPKFPDLTLVREQIPGQADREYVVGDKLLRERLEQQIRERELAAAAERHTAKSPSELVAPPSARPGDFRTAAWKWWPVAIAVALVALAIAFVMKRKQAGNR
uniref:Uncharacterized protein n=1 Tax=Schlesneria paludicola TaxID=360056 RepID=A0A7C2JYQ8_9PLAN